MMRALLGAALLLCTADVAHTQCCSDGSTSCLTMAQNVVGAPSVSASGPTSLSTEVPLRVTYSSDTTGSLVSSFALSSTIMVKAIAEPRLPMSGLPQNPCNGLMILPAWLQTQGVGQSNFHFHMQHGSFAMFNPAVCGTTSGGRNFLGALFLGTDEERLPSEECIINLACANDQCICPTWTETKACTYSTKGFNGEDCGVAVRTEQCSTIPSYIRSISCPTIECSVNTPAPTDTPTFAPVTPSPSSTPAPSVAKTASPSAPSTPPPILNPAVTQKPAASFSTQSPTDMTPAPTSSPTSVAPATPVPFYSFSNTNAKAENYYNDIVCEYAKDTACFDSTFPCQSCCESDLNAYGSSCWDEVYTRARCCKSVKEMATAPPVDFAGQPSTSAPVKVYCPYEKDETCFNAYFSCEGCCTTGFSTGGTDCWDGFYTPQRCCSNSSPAMTPAPSQEVGVVTYCTTPDCSFPPPPSPTAVPTGYPTFSYWSPAPIVSNSGGSCSDTNTLCPSWASIGYCQAYPAEMADAGCSLSCNTCSPVSQPSQPSVPTPSVFPPSSAGCAADTNEYCDAWRQGGYCQTFSSVREMCPTSCGCSGRRSADSLGAMTDGERHELVERLVAERAPIALDSRGRPIDSRGQPLPMPGSADAEMARIGRPSQKPSPASPLLIVASVGAVCVAVAGVLVYKLRASKSASSASTRGGLELSTGSASHTEASFA